MESPTFEPLPEGNLSRFKFPAGVAMPAMGGSCSVGVGSGGPAFVEAQVSLLAEGKHIIENSSDWVLPPKRIVGTVSIARLTTGEDLLLVEGGVAIVLFEALGPLPNQGSRPRNSTRPR